MLRPCLGLVWWALVKFNSCHGQMHELLKTIYKIKTQLESNLQDNFF